MRQSSIVVEILSNMGVSWKEHTNGSSLLIFWTLQQCTLQFWRYNYLFFKSNFCILKILQSGLKFEIFVNWFNHPSTFKFCIFVCILWNSWGTPITNKERLGFSFSIWSCEVKVMAKIVAKSQIGNVTFDSKKPTNHM